MTSTGKDNDPKQTAKATQEFFNTAKQNILQWPVIEDKTYVLAENVTNKQQLKVTALKTRQSIPGEKIQHLDMSFGSRL